MLLGLAFLAFVSLGSSARNWTSMWRGFDQLTMGVESIDVSDDRQAILVTVALTNQSDEHLRIHVLDTGIRLSGRSVTAGSERFDDVVLDPGESVALQTTQRVSGADVSFLDSRLASGDETWNLNGRVQVSVEGLSDELWLPFRADVRAE